MARDYDEMEDDNPVDDDFDNTLNGEDSRFYIVESQ